MSRNSFWLLLLSVGNPYIAWRGPDWTWPRLGHLSCHVCLCNPAKLRLRLWLRLWLLLLAYANARHCYCDSFLWLQQLCLNMYAKCDLHITRPRAEREVGRVGMALVCLLAGLRYAIFAAQHWLQKTTDYALCIPFRYVRVCAPCMPPSPSLHLAICQLCDRQTSDSACLTVMTPACPSRTCDSIYMRIRPGLSDYYAKILQGVHKIS